MKRTFRLLRPDEIEVRVGQVSKEGSSRDWYSLLLYKDARCDMNILDETVGSANWSRSHYELKGVIYCRVGVKFPLEYLFDEAGNATNVKTYSDWTYKDDCGTESNTEKEKGESSDSFKRACVNWGIGRELYTSPKMFVSEPWKGIGDRRFLYIESINYDDLGNITDVTIRDYKDQAFIKKFANR